MEIPICIQVDPENIEASTLFALQCNLMFNVQVGIGFSAVLQNLLEELLPPEAGQFKVSVHFPALAEGDA